MDEKLGRKKSGGIHKTLATDDPELSTSVKRRNPKNPVELLLRSEGIRSFRTVREVKSEDRRVMNTGGFCVKIC